MRKPKRYRGLTPQERAARDDRIRAARESGQRVTDLANEFGLSVSMVGLILHPRLREANRGAALDWAASHRDIARAKSGAWRTKNPERHRENVRRWRSEQRGKDAALG